MEKIKSAATFLCAAMKDNLKKPANRRITNIRLFGAKQIKIAKC
jgi:hypothetical protein